MFRDCLGAARRLRLRGEGHAASPLRCKQASCPARDPEQPRGRSHAPPRHGAPRRRRPARRCRGTRHPGAHRGILNPVSRITITRRVSTAPRRQIDTLYRSSIQDLVCRPTSPTAATGNGFVPDGPVARWIDRRSASSIPIARRSSESLAARSSATREPAESRGGVLSRGREQRRSSQWIDRRSASSIPIAQTEPSATAQPAEARALASGGAPASTPLVMSPPWGRERRQVARSRSSCSVGWVGPPSPMVHWAFTTRSAGSSTGR